jgi:GT2 family glycosyltransferase
MTHKISIVVATKDRPADLRRLLESLRQQTVKPAEVLIVDASSESVESVVTPSRNFIRVMHATGVLRRRRCACSPRERRRAPRVGW